ncbi:hypothetical protein FHS43_005646 [Streptosporangium becharense]|uniref:Uncharacterized protein n=1 Tax=Streptosporangium becharense TaxID=1816182 RepID=A0A7W9MKK6_9ACTN|nr:hypothetical protein [Streptosporangium becharense]MBB2914334.1 hypothetical protein [Streptosporangium becharense]MBB5823634.1 hypothetical protein [Streptosporangium becharense]
MISVLYGGLALVQAALAVRLARSGLWIPFAVAAGVAYDSAVVGAGRLIGEGPGLQALSTGRFIAHAVLTPLLIVHAAALVRRGLTAPAWGLAGALIVLDTVSLADLRLEPRWWSGTLRHVSADPPGPPIAALVTTVILLAAGVTLWVRRRTPWLCLGAAALLATAGAAVTVPVLGNAGEAVLIAAIAATGDRDGRRGPGR